MSGCCGGSAMGGGLVSAVVQGLRLPWSLAICSFDVGGRMAAGMWSMVLPPGLAAGLPGFGRGGRAGVRPGSSPPPPAVSSPFAPPAAAGAAGFDLSSNRAVELQPPGGGTTAAHSIREEPKMADVNLCDDMVKLVQFAIVSVRRDLYDLDRPERPLWSGTEVISDNLREMDFSSYIIARYCNRIPPRDRPYVRVWYQVLERWPKPCLNYEERQLTELRRIADCICYGEVRGREEEYDVDVDEGDGGEEVEERGKPVRGRAGGGGRGRQAGDEATAG